MQPTPLGRETELPLSPYASYALGDGPLRTLPRRPALTVSPATSVREALGLMDRSLCDAAIVADEQSRLPLGLITLSDVVLRISMNMGDLDEPVVAVMTAAPPTLPADAPSHRATVLMTKRYARHVVLVDRDGKVENLLSQADLFGLRGGGAETLAETVAQAADVRAMIKAADAIRKRGAELFTAGMGAEAICHWMSALNDLVCIRVIELIEDEFDLPPIPWCWVVFGSEGRLEQTFSTDQDNGLIFLPGFEEETDELRKVFLDFAQAVNKGLDSCGFRLCKGNIMAGNPSWCLSVKEWRRIYTDWMRVPDPKAVLNSTIFFDFRPLYGRQDLVDDLRSWLLPQAADFPRFLRSLAEDALTCEPAIGWMGKFVYDGGREHPRTVDLKLHGARPFVDAARIWGLAHGIWATNTADRLRGAAESMNRRLDETAAAVEAFHLVQRFRIQQQLTTNDPDRVNRVEPSSLNELNKLMLKEAFKQAKRLQQRLRLDFSL
jgi:CBS domain-containing protein